MLLPVPSSNEATNCVPEGKGKKVMRAAPASLELSQLSAGSMSVIGFEAIGTTVSERGKTGALVELLKLTTNGAHCWGVEKLTDLKKESTARV